VEVRGTSLLWLDGPEILHVPADTAPGVLPEPIHQRGEVDGITCGPPVVVAVRIHRRAVGINPTVAVEGEGEECRGPVATGEHPPHRALVDRSAGKVRGVLTSPGGALDRFGWWIEGSEPSAYSERAEFTVEFGDGLGDLLTRDLITVGLALGIGREEIGSDGHQLSLLLSGWGPVGGGFGVEVPALAALGHPQSAGLLRTGVALVFSGGPTRDRDDVDAAGGGVDPAHGQGPDADAVLFGQDVDDISAEWQRGPLSPGHPSRIKGGGVGDGHQRVISSVACPGVARWRRVVSVTVVVAPGVRSAPGT
jgi:hypothetical protein